MRNVKRQTQRLTQPIANTSLNTLFSIIFLNDSNLSMNIFYFRSSVTSKADPRYSSSDK